MPEVVGDENACSNRHSAVNFYLKEFNVNSLDDVPAHAGLGRALNLFLDEQSNVRCIARRLVEGKYLSSDLPDMQLVPTISTRKSRYLDSAVVGKEKSEDNTIFLIKRILSNTKISDLDELRKYPDLCFLLGGRDLLKASIKLISLGLIDRNIPDNHAVIVKGKTSMYFKSTVVGQDFANQNREEAIRTLLRRWNIGSSDQIEKKHTYGLGTLLELKAEERRSIGIIGEVLVEKGFLSFHSLPVVDEKHLRYTLSAYPEVAGLETCKKTCSTAIRRFLADNKVGNIEEVKFDFVLADLLSAFEDRPTKLSSIIKLLVKHEFISGVMPESHQIWNKDQLTRYLRPDLVGIELASDNRIKAVRSYLNKNQIRSLDGICKSHGARLSTILGRDAHPNAVEVCKTLLGLYFFSPVALRGVELAHGNSVSSYLNPKIVGEQQARENVVSGALSFIADNYIRSLDQLGTNYGLASALGVPVKDRKSKWSLAKRMVELGVLEREIPLEILSDTNITSTLYTDVRAVGSEAACANELQIKAYFSEHKDPFLEKSQEVHRRKMGTLRKRRNVLFEGQHYDSTDEAVCAEFFKQLLPGWESKEGLTYQIEVGFRSFDFRIGDILLEYHPILIFWSQSGLGDFSSEGEYKDYLKRLSVLELEEERRFYRKEVIEHLGRVYQQERSDLALQYKSILGCTSVIWVNGPEDLFDKILAPYALPYGRNRFVREFNARKRKYWAHSKALRNTITLD